MSMTAGDLSKHISMDSVLAYQIMKVINFEMIVYHGIQYM